MGLTFEKLARVAISTKREHVSVTCRWSRHGLYWPPWLRVRGRPRQGTVCRPRQPHMGGPIGTADYKASVMSFCSLVTAPKKWARPSTTKVSTYAQATTAPSPSCAASGVETTVRPSLAFYNTFEEIDRLIAVVRRLASVRRTG